MTHIPRTTSTRSHETHALVWRTHARTTRTPRPHFAMCGHPLHHVPGRPHRLRGAPGSLCARPSLVGPPCASRQTGPARTARVDATKVMRSTRRADDHDSRSARGRYRAWRKLKLWLRLMLMARRPCGWRARPEMRGACVREGPSGSLHCHRARYENPPAKAAAEPLWC